MRLTATLKQLRVRTSFRPLRPGDPVRLEITASEDNVGFVLVRYDADDIETGDTWHLTVDEAKLQAEHEFAVDPEAWAETD